MLVALFFGISRCISSDLCPDDEALIAAVTRRDDAVVSSISNQAAEENPSAITLVHMEGVRSISGVICSGKIPGDLPTITCKFTVRYSTRNAYHVARLIKKDGVWDIDEALAVSRKRR